MQSIEKEYIESIEEGKREIKYLKKKEILSIGCGLGADYAIQGANVLVYVKDLGFFFGMGTGDNRAEIDDRYYVGGMRLRMDKPFSNSLVNGYATVIYGPNLVEDGVNKYGVSFGGGMDIHFSRRYASYFTVGINGLVYNEKQYSFLLGEEEGEKLKVTPRLTFGLRLALLSYYK